MKTTTFGLLFDFLLEKHTKDNHFTLGDLVSKLGLKEGSVRTYLSKKLLDVYVKKRGDGSYSVDKFGKVTKEYFATYMSQKSAEVRESKKEIYDRLKERAEQSFFLSLEIFNRVTQKNKNEAFCILMVNAWELLLKSIIAKENGTDEIYFKEDPSKTISISECIRRIYISSSDPVRKNLEKLVELRDKAVHLLIPELSFDISRLFQSSVINFSDLVSEKYGEHVLRSISPGFIALVIDDSNTIDFERINQDYGTRSASELKAFLDRFRAEENSNPDIKFAVPIEYKLVLTKKEENSDIQLYKSASSDTKARIIEVAKDIDTTHPHLRNGLLEAINQGLETLGLPSKN